MKTTTRPATDHDLKIVAELVAVANGKQAAPPAAAKHKRSGPAPYESLPISLGRVGGEWITPVSSPRDDAVLLYVHGGRWQFEESVDVYGGKLAVATGLPVLQVRYRLVPEYRYPAQLDDVVEAYRRLVWNDAGAKKIFLLGHSGGATLVLSALLAFRKVGLPMPAGAIALSAATDFTMVSESIAVNDGKDLVTDEVMREVSEGYLGEADPAGAPQSPLAGDLSGLPPLMIVSGSVEKLLDDSTRFAQKAADAGVEVDLEVYDGMPHAFPLFELDAAADLLERVKAFTNDH